MRVRTAISKVSTDLARTKEIPVKVSVTTLIGVAGLAASLALGACATSATTGDYTIFGKDTGVNAVAAQADVNSALATACPIVGVIQANPPAMSAFQKQALAQLAGACPPNAAPTNVVTAATDILAAYEALAPLVHK